jgi:DNA modification methylase
MFQGLFEDFISQERFRILDGQVQLIFTSPPFPLNNKKAYDNKQGDEYKSWLKAYAPIFKRLLRPDGSLVIEMGNAWEPGLPVMSTLAIEALLDFKRECDFHLCQQFVVNNPARLPSPAQWVTINRIRVTDSFTNVWWLSPSTNPKADNRRVLRPYSGAMKKLLARKSYNDGARPSGHHISATSFLTDHGGAIPHNALNERDGILPDTNGSLFPETETFTWEHGNGSLLEISNTKSSDPYLNYCKDRALDIHPARMQVGLPEFFIKFLTDEKDIVLDPFAGSNTTGAAAEALSRCWLSFEPQADYVKGSLGRFKSVERKEG